MESKTDDNNSYTIKIIPGDGGKVKYLLFYSERIYTRLAFDSEAPIKSLFTKKPSDRERLREVKEKIEAAGFRLSQLE